MVVPRASTYTYLDVAQPPTREGTRPTSDNSMSRWRTSRIRRTVASSDWRFKLVGGRRSIPLEMACGLEQQLMNDRPSLVRCTHLTTLTDQARFSGFELNVVSSVDLVSAVRTFESRMLWFPVVQDTPYGKDDKPSNPRPSSFSWYEAGQYATP